jgi:Ca-activated chloride channel homolog
MKKLIPLMMVVVLLAAACSGQDASDRSQDWEPADRDGDRSTRIDDRDQAVSPTIASSGADAPFEEERGEEPRAEPPADVEFRDYGENPFTRPDEDNLSTFAVDVDTGSYTVMRQWVSEGLVPPPESVRPEEYVNFFDQGYPAPDRDTFAVYADGGPTPWTDQSEDVVLRIGIKGRELAERVRPTVNLTFVVDVSGSMEEDGRLGLVKDSLEMLVDQLDGDDNISIVAYDTDAWVVLESTPGDDTRAVLAAIDELSPGGTTNAEAGILLGYELAAESFDAEAVNRVVLLSDGVANVGEEGPEGILEQIARDVNSGVSLMTVGVGLGNYNDVLMEQLADGADGLYRYVDDLEEARRIFVNELTGTLVTIAQDVKVQVAFERENVAWYRLIGFENRDVADDDFRDDRVDGGEIGAGHTVTALYQVELGRGVSGNDRLAEVSVRWADPDRGGLDEVKGEVTADLLSGRWSETPTRFRLATTVAAYAEELRDGRYATAYDMLDVAEEVERLAEETEDPDVWELSDLVSSVAGEGRRR